TGLERARAAEQGHEGHEAAIAAAVDAGVVTVALVVGHHPVQAIQVVLQLRVAHPAVDRGAPVAAVALAAAVVQVQDHVALLDQQVVEHLLAEVVGPARVHRSEEHTSELQSRENLVCRLLLEKKNKNTTPKKADEDSRI